MAIKIIREGQKIFTAFCERCGCEFTYELSDLQFSASDKVPCPCCGKDFYHKPSGKAVTINTEQPSLWDYVTPCSDHIEANLKDDTKCNCGDNAVCSKCSGSSGTYSIKYNPNSKTEIKCMCEGDIWNTCGCHIDNTDCNATKTAIEAAQASCNHTLKELCGSIKTNQ